MNVSEGCNVRGFPGSEGLWEVSGHTVIETSIWWCEGGGGSGHGYEPGERGQKE